MLFSDLEKITEGNSQLFSENKLVKFSTDTRTLTGNPGDVFVAIKGANRDGHDFIPSALEKGVNNFIVEKKVPIDSANVFVVKDSLEAFHQIAIHYRDQFLLPVVGITGSNGKTVVKEWLSSLLAKKYYVVKSPKSYNSQVGVPISIMEMRPSHQIAIFEAGVSQAGEMSKLQQIIKPNVGIFTTLGEAHAEGFSSEEEKLREKLTLFKNADKVICRSDTPWFKKLVVELSKPPLITWTLTGDADHLVQWEGSGIIVDDVRYETNFNTDAELENATHCIVAALHFNLNPVEIQEGLQRIRPIPMRLELKKGVNDCYILDDSYNNDLGGLRVALDYLNTQQQHEKRTLILSDILHSSKSDTELYQEINELLKKRKVNRLVGVGNRIKGAKGAFSIDTQFFDSTSELLQKMPDFEGEMILVKGARDFELEKVVKVLEDKSHGTVLEVNFEALQHNLSQYRNLLSPETKLMVMVKANAYGMGLLEVANFLQHQRVDHLGVAYVDEAIELRKNGITIPIMIMNPYVESFGQFEKYDLEAEIFSLQLLKRFLRDTGGGSPIHIKIDTGMHRLGFSKPDIPELIRVLKENPQIKVGSIFTHFSSSDSAQHDEFTVEQASLFNDIYNQIADAVGYNPTKHACNSPGIVRWSQYHFDLVRLGIGLYGFDPVGQLRLRPAGQLKTVVSQIQSLSKGETVGYSRKGKISRDSKIAVLPIGYEDGFLRIFGNGKTKVLINGHLCPTVGNICMDMTMVDVTQAEAKEGDEAIIFGESPTLSDLADAAHTIPYEILTNVSNRVKRVFVSE